MLRRFIIIIIAISTASMTIHGQSSSFSLSEENFDFALPHLTSRGSRRFKEMVITDDITTPTKNCSLFDEHMHDKNAVCINGITLSDASIREATMLSIHCDSGIKLEDVDPSFMNLVEFISIKELKIYNCPMERLPKMPRQLGKISLFHLDHLKEIDGDFEEMISLVDLEVNAAERLNRVGQLPQNLRVLTIVDAPELAECGKIQSPGKAIKMLTLNFIGFSHRPLCLDKSFIIEKSLTLLDLSHNHIENFNKILGNGHIHKLSLNNVHDSESNPIVLRGCNEMLINLKELELKEIGFENILGFYKGQDNHDFCLKSLKKLNLAGNYIQKLSFDDIQNVYMRTLQYLDLSNNYIEYLPMDEPQKIKTDNTLILDIRDNKINANCKLKDFLQKIDKLEYIQLKSNCRTMAIEIEGSTDPFDRYKRMPCNSEDSLYHIAQRRNLMCLKPLMPSVRLNDKSKNKILKPNKKQFSIQNDSPFRQTNEKESTDNYRTIDLSRVENDFDDTILCETTGDPQPEINWYLLDKRTKSGTLISNKQLILSRDLLKKLSHLNADEALVSCNAKNDVGQSNITLKIILPSNIINRNTQRTYIQSPSSAQSIYSCIHMYIIIVSIIFYN